MTRDKTALVLVTQNEPTLHRPGGNEPAHSDSTAQGSAEAGSQAAAADTHTPEQAEHDDQADDVPDVRPVPGNLQVEMDTFVGRRCELADGRRLLEQTRLLTLTGPGGVGKTRLAQRLAAEAAQSGAEDCPQGVWMVSLAELTEAEQVAAHLSEVLGWAFNGSQPISLEILLGRLSKTRLTLVLDNCEHLADPVAGLVRRILQTAPGVRVLATSRAPLHVPGESLMSVPPLETGGDDLHPGAPDGHCEAVQLLFERAKTAGAELCEDDRPDANRLCQLLDGIPLAIELAAKRLRTIGIKILVTKLAEDGRFGLLAGRLAAAISWSVDLCSDSERHLWDRLAVFAGSFTLGAAEAVCSDDTIPAADVAELLMGLVDQSMLVADICGGEARYRMLTPMRSFAERQLHVRGEEMQIRTAHAEHYRIWAASVASAVQSPREIEWLREIRREMPNFRAGMDWFLTSGQAHQALELAAALSQSRWGYYSGQLGEARLFLERALDAQTEPHPLQVLSITLLATIGVCQGDHDMVRFRNAQADRLTAQLGDTPVLRSWVMFSQALLMLYADADPAAIEVFEQAQQLWLDHAPDGAVYPARSFGAMCAAYVGTAEYAVRVTDDSLARAEKTGAPLGINWARWCRGVAELNHGSPYRAIELILQTLTSWVELGDRWGPTWATEALAWCFVRVGRYEQAAVLMGAARQWQQDSVGLMDVGTVEQMHTASATVARAQLGRDEFAEATARGAAMTRQEILAFAQEHAVASSQRPGIPGGLTQREYKVAGLVAAGLTNADIGRKLFVSTRTIDTQVSSIYTKLDFHGVGSRTRLTTWWISEQQ
ncbi:LuxR C-terminal-related transcriptional regulator [Lentzea sp. NPDC051213]|uniref:LuxR C-terminal-related transcriptional regulator n=1 Tax=Lentzea sp. NPDC051213 TaxID=3364126 RepID=UPI0037AC1924